MKKGILKIKAGLSILLLLDFILVLITGIMLYWNAGPKNTAMLHTVTGFLMGVIVIIHIVLNLKLLRGEATGKIEIRFKQD